jgi:chromosome segregation and condensation protein ScpB
MSLPLNSSSSPERIGLPDAVMKVIAELATGSGLSISTLSKRTGIDRRTVDKAISLIMELQDTLRSRELTKDKIGRRYVVRMKETSARAREVISTASKKLKRG